MSERSAEFGIGQIVHHRRYDYRGVIIGVDLTFQGDEAWYEFQVQGKDYRPAKDRPWYHVLVDGATHQTYVAEQNLEPGDAERPIQHPLLDRYFQTFFRGRYHPEALS